MSVDDSSRPRQQVAALRHGTVIDHLNPGTALKALSILGVPQESAALLGIHLESEKLGRKDIVKIADVEITKDQIDKIALLGPQATVSFIRDFEVHHKVTVELPDDIIAILRCPNPNCITNHETVVTRFAVLRRHRLLMRCHFCERRVLEQDVQVI